MIPDIPITLFTGAVVLLLIPMFSIALLIALWLRFRHKNVAPLRLRRITLTHRILCVAILVLMFFTVPYHYLVDLPGLDEMAKEVPDAKVIAQGYRVAFNQLYIYAAIALVIGFISNKVWQRQLQAE